MKSISNVRCISDCDNCGHKGVEGLINEYGDFQCLECEEGAQSIIEEENPCTPFIGDYIDDMAKDMGE